jgi:hypothetical protein
MVEKGVYTVCILRETICECETSGASTNNNVVCLIEKCSLLKCYDTRSRQSCQDKLGTRMQHFRKTTVLNFLTGTQRYGFIYLPLCMLCNRHYRTVHRLYLQPTTKHLCNSRPANPYHTFHARCGEPCKNPPDVSRPRGGKKTADGVKVK